MTREQVRQHIRNENSRIIAQLDWDPDITIEQRDICLLDTMADLYGTFVVQAVVRDPRHPPSDERLIQMRQQAQWDLSRAGIALMSQFAKEEGSQN